MKVDEMQLRVYDGATLIGVAEVFALDPPMGVAMAKFKPSSAYASERHANVIEGDFVADRSDLLRVETANGTRIQSNAVSIQDFTSIGEIELHIFEIFEPAFADLFKDHPDYVAYWKPD